MQTFKSRYLDTKDDIKKFSTDLRTSKRLKNIKNKEIVRDGVVRFLYCV